MHEWREELRRRLASLHLAPAEEAGIVEELAQHLEDRFRDLVSQGHGAAEARSIALD